MNKFCLHATVSAIFWKFFSVSDEVLVQDGFHRVARICILIAYRWLFRGSRPSLRTLCALLLSSHHTFQLAEFSLLFFFLLKQAWTLCFRFCVSTFLMHHLLILSSLFQKNVRAHASANPLDKLWMAKTKTRMPCVGLFLVHLVCWFKVHRGLLVMICQHRFPACMLLTSRCHWISYCSQFFRGIRRLWTRCRRQCCWNMMTILIQREALSCPLYEKMSSHLGSYVEFRRCPLIWISAFWAMHIYQATESLAFHRVIALLRTGRDPDQKTCAFSSICTAPSRGKSHVVFLTSKYPLYLSSILLCSALCIEAPESKTNIQSSVSLTPSQEIRA